jgi:tol-pal system protein YbgF
MTAMVRNLPPGTLWRRGLLMLPLAAFCLAALCLAAPAAQAQSVDDQLQRLQRELSDLQRQVYSGQTPPAATGDAGGGVAPTQAARIQLQLNELEMQMQELTGRLEDIGFRIEETSGRLDRLVADVDLRLRNLEEGGLPPVGAQTPAEEPGTSMAAETPAEQPAGALSPAQPGTIGSISESDLSSFQQQQAAQLQAPQQAGQQSAAAPVATAALPGGTPQQKYDYAFGLLRQANYAGAEQAFAAFLADHPQDALAGNAKYWLGETYYVRGNYQQAAVTFAEGFETYPNNSKAPDNLLKLGMSLASLGSTEDACGTFTVLLDRYGDAPATILSRAQRESQRLGCR